MRRLGGTVAVALGVVYLLIGVFFFLLPDDQQGAGAASLLGSLVEDGAAIFLTWQWLFVLSGALGLAVVMGLGTMLPAQREGGVRWASAFGYLGFAVTIVQAFTVISFIYGDGHRDFVEADAQMQDIILGAFSARAVAPQGWASFGLIGLWLASLSVMALMDGALPRGAAVLGLMGSAGYWLVPLAGAMDVQVLVTVAAVLAIAVAPAFYIWAGLTMRRGNAAT